MKAITLVGKSNSGKTMTIETLIYKILVAGGQLNYTKPKHIKNRNFLTKENANLFKEEFENELSLEQFKTPPFDLTVKFDYQGKIVLITTAGDSLEYIRSIYEKNKPCDIFICASHNSDVMINGLESLGDVTYIPQYRVEKIKDATALNKAIIERNNFIASKILNGIK